MDAWFDAHWKWACGLLSASFVIVYIAVWINNARNTRNGGGK